MAFQNPTVAGAADSANAIHPLLVDPSGNLLVNVAAGVQGTVAAQTAAWTSATAVNSVVSIGTTGYGTVEASIQLSGTANTVSDGLTTANGQTLYPNGDLHAANGSWVYQGSSTFQVSTVNTGSYYPAIYCSAAGVNFAYRNDVAWPNDQYVEVVATVNGVAATQNCGPAVRVSAAAQTAYYAQFANNLFTLNKIVAGVATQLGTTSTFPVGGDRVRLSVSGSNLTVTLNGVSVITASDSAIASGNAGIYGAGNSTTNGYQYWTAGMPTNPSVAFETSDNAGTTWYPMQGGRPGNFIADTTYDLTGSTQTWQFSNTGFTNFRIRLANPLITGTANVRVQAAAAPSQDVVISTPQGLYVKATDFLWVNVTPVQSLSTAEYYITYRIQPPTGPAIQTSTVRKLTMIAGSFAPVSVPLQEGWIQNITVTPGTSTPYAASGVLYIQLYLDSQGLQLSPQQAILLFGGTTTQNFAVSWPGTPSATPQQVPGVPSTIYPANPAAGTDFVWNPSNSFRYKIHCVGYTFTASSAVSNRYLGLYMRTNNVSKNLWVSQNPTPVTATQVSNAYFAPSFPYNSTNLSAIAVLMNCPIPDQVWFSGASNASTGQDGISFLSSNTPGIQAGDQISNITIRAEIQNDTD